jgi:hypothetical protein
MPRRAHVPDIAQRRQVEAMAAYGIPEPDISRVVGIDPKTLRKHYRDELDMGATKANAQVAGFLFNSAKNGNVSAQIFWLKTRARWRETPVELQHSGSMSLNAKPMAEYSDAELLSMLASMVDVRATLDQLPPDTDPKHQYRGFLQLVANGEAAPKG